MRDRDSGVGRGAAIVLVLAGAVGLAACGGEGSGPVDPPVDPAPGGPTVHGLRIEFAGVPERGAIVTLSVAPEAGAPPVPGPIVTGFTPEGALQSFPDGRFRIQQTGTLRITAEYEGDEVRWKGEREVEVGLPPRFVFDMEEEGERNLYRARLDGTELQRLTEHPSPDTQPTVGGGWVVFVGERHGNAELYRIPVGGGTVERLTTTAAVEASPALSPDGTRLAWISDASGAPRLRIGAPDASGATAPTEGITTPGAVESGPSWSGDGTRVAFTSTESGVPRLRQLDVATGVVTPLGPGGGAPELQPRWNPERAEVAFVSEAGGLQGIFLLEEGTGMVRQVTGPPGSSGEPAWITEDRIVYTASTPGGTQLRWIHVDRPAWVHTVSLPGSAPRHPAPVRTE